MFGAVSQADLLYSRRTRHAARNGRSASSSRIYFHRRVLPEYFARAELGLAGDHAPTRQPRTFSVHRLASLAGNLFRRLGNSMPASTSQGTTARVRRRCAATRFLHGWGARRTYFEASLMARGAGLRAWDDDARARQIFLASARLDFDGGGGALRAYSKKNAVVLLLNMHLVPATLRLYV